MINLHATETARNKKVAKKKKKKSGAMTNCLNNSARTARDLSRIFAHSFIFSVSFYVTGTVWISTYNGTCSILGMMRCFYSDLLVTDPQEKKKKKKENVPTPSGHRHRPRHRPSSRWSGGGMVTRVWIPIFVASNNLISEVKFRHRPLSSWLCQVISLHRGSLRGIGPRYLGSLRLMLLGGSG